MIYVLIMIVAYGTNTAAVTTQEFSSKEKCEIALNTIINARLIDKRSDPFSYWYNKSVLLCVER